MSVTRVFHIFCLMLSLLMITACNPSPEPAPPSTKDTGSPITLKMNHWIGIEAGSAVTTINDRFHAEYPNITIQYENAPVDQYQNIIKARFVAGDAPDIVGVFPGTWKDPFVQSGFLMDLTDSPWAPRLKEAARNIMMNDGKLYALPVDQNAIGVIYNKKIFRDLHIPEPTTWSGFLQVCNSLKSSGVIPLSLGVKDLWVTQILPYAMVPTAIYRNHPDFDHQMYEGTASFLDSPWKNVLNDYVELNKRGYFNKGTLGTTYDQMIQLFATGKTAMMIMGTWALEPIRIMNPDLELGMFPLPYTKDGQPPWVSYAVSVGIGASSTTKYPEAVKKYIDFWSRPDINAFFLKEAKAFPTFDDITVDLGPAQQEISHYFTAGTSNFPDQKWPPGVQDALFQGIQQLLIDDNYNRIPDILSSMDRAFKTNKDKLNITNGK